MTPALLRVRSPFVKKNILAFFIIGSVPVGIYAYTMLILRKDEFSDIPVPPVSDEELSKLKKEYEKSKN